MAHAIDTLRITQKLESAGVDRRHAEAHAEALNEVVVTEFSELATKADLERLPTREDLNHFATKADLERLPTREDALRHQGGSEALRHQGGSEALRDQGGSEALRDQGGSASLRHQGGPQAASHQIGARSGPRQSRKQDVPAMGRLDGHVGHPHHQHAVRGRLTRNRPVLRAARGDTSVPFTLAESRGRTPAGNASQGARRRRSRRRRPPSSDRAHPSPGAPRASSRAGP